MHKSGDIQPVDGKNQNKWGRNERKQKLDGKYIELVENKKISLAILIKIPLLNNFKSGIFYFMTKNIFY